MIAAQCKDTPLCFDPDAEPGKTVYCVFEDETLLETVEPLPITDNHGKPTIEVYRSNDALFIADNYKNRELRETRSDKMVNRSFGPKARSGQVFR